MALLSWYTEVGFLIELTYLDDGVKTGFVGVDVEGQ